jgi:predicted transcriptional regulator
MKTLSFKLPESVLEKLDAAARERGESSSALLREAIETVLSGGARVQNGSCLDLAKDLAGSVKGPEDLIRERSLKDVW